MKTFRLNEPRRAAACGIPCTARHLVLLEQGAAEAAGTFLHHAAGMRMAAAQDCTGGLTADALAIGCGVLFPRLGWALVHADPDQVRSLRRAAGPVLRVEPERLLKAADHPGDPRPTPVPPPYALPFADDDIATWGLRATGVLSSPFSGDNVRLAILDAGVDPRHPDFASRRIRSRSFVTATAEGDLNGHGTFCAGIACGPRRARRGPRYGVAPDATLYSARVLDEQASGTDGGTLAGIEWAVSQGCEVISLSLGAPVGADEPYPEIYEEIARRALAAGSVVIAPAGNSSLRPDEIEPVERPANCPSILAVGAVSPSLTIAGFSNGTADLVAPGVAIRSAARAPELYQFASGTSMAAPFVAGIAALLAESRPDKRGAALRDLLLCTVLPMASPAHEVGAGLVRAPQ